MYLWIFALTFVLASDVLAQGDAGAAMPAIPSEPTAVSSSEKTFEFNKSANQGTAKKHPHGRLKLTDKKEGVFLEFEGHRLSKGSYALVKLSSCDKKSFKGIPEGSELMSFETNFGDISSENTLANQTVSSLQLEKNKIAMVKKGKAKPAFVYCAE